jgi:hypothetical protein
MLKSQKKVRFMRKSNECAFVRDGILCMHVFFVCVHVYIVYMLHVSHDNNSYSNIRYTLVQHIEVYLTSFENRFPIIHLGTLPGYNKG